MVTGTHRVTIAGILWCIAATGVLLASLRSASLIWTTIASTATLAVLLTGVLGAVLARGPARAFWLGFAIFGWVYLVFVEWDWIGGPLGRDLTAGLSALADNLVPEPVIPTLVSFGTGPRGRQYASNPARFEALQLRSTKLGNFVQIGRMTLSVLFAYLGGRIAQILASRPATNDRTEDS